MVHKPTESRDSHCRSTGAEACFQQQTRHDLRHISIMFNRLREQRRVRMGKHRAG